MNNSQIYLYVDIVCLIVSSMFFYHGYKLKKENKKQKATLRKEANFSEKEIPELPFPACLLIK